MALAADLENILGNIGNVLRDNPTRRDPTSVPVSPEKEYTIFFTARSGSTYLTELLKSVKLGDPREWLNPGFVKDQAHYFGANNFRDYFLRMRSEFSPGGVFGHEITLWFYNYFSQEVRLEDYFNFKSPSIFLFRENIVEQAVSLFLAVGRGVFHKSSDEGDVAYPDVPYDASEIKRYIEMFCSEERGLQTLFDQNGWTPYYLSYETIFSHTPREVAISFGNMLKVDLELDKINPRMQKVGDSVNASYAERFSGEDADYCADVMARRVWLIEKLNSRGLLKVR